MAQDWSLVDQSLLLKIQRQRIRCLSRRLPSKLAGFLKRRVAATLGQGKQTSILSLVME
jgi:hypothetical protein